MLVRNHKDSDIPEIAKLYYNTVHIVNSKDYTPEQIQAWASSKSQNEQFWQKRFQNYSVYVVEAEEKVIGFAEFEATGHIDCFYVHHLWQNKGVGSKLMKHIEIEAKKQGILKLFAEVSVTAKPFFKKMGFNAIKEQEKLYENLKFKQFLMEKNLSIAEHLADQEQNI